MNKICFCKQELEEDDDVIDDQCRMCCRQILKDNEQLIYTCFNEKCFYRTTLESGWYFICDDCYNDMGHDNGDNDVETDYGNVDEITFYFVN